MSQPVRRAARRGAIAAVLADSFATSAGVARAASGPYVALGDSYTAAPLVPDPTGNPIPCGRSTNNYPQDVKRAISPTSFTDASCSSATTADMTQSQSLEGGVQTAPPQFNALGTQDALVTLGIGGNDAGLIGVAEECAKLDAALPFGSRCKSHYNSGGTDNEVTKINAAGPKVASTIQGIHARAPQANGATYADTFSSSIGHDACKGSSAWVNGIIPTSAAFPLHPNATGEANMAKQVEGNL